MPNPTPIRLLGAAALLSVSALAAAQQTPAPDPSPPAEKPPMARPESAPQTAPIPTPKNPATPPGASQANLIGLTVISADGSKVGDVRAVRAAMDGKVTALRVYSGGFLGFGGRIVEIPEGRFTQIGDVVRLSLTAEDVSKLPAVKDAS
jgi:sporulation protein YlmC with PRC-barrel domain